MSKDNIQQFGWSNIITIVIVLGSMLVGYVQLSEAVKANSTAIEKQAAAMERITELMVNDVRHEEQLSSLRRDLNIVWEEFKSHQEKSNYDTDRK